MIDTHCHLQEDYRDVLLRAFANGVHHVFNICISVEDIERGLKIVEEFPTVYPVAGIHPCHAHEVEKGHFEWVVELAEQKKIIAIGESGLDLHHSLDHLDIQKEYFKKHIELANDLNLPLSIHCRNAYQELMDFTAKYPVKKGILHCFAGDETVAKWALEHGYILSFSGVVTFKNALKMQQIAAQTPLDSLIIETDAPWLAPDPYRGKKNEPAYIPFILKKIASLKGLSENQVQNEIFSTCKKLFGF
ncbi:MAG: TatD family hydrolase [Verrucomicrobia bacterium]|nr:TatD family hydrolase [Verrucomicrobiota bacterium]NDE63391.1 TatD family deoxyribonuclease [Chlamydiota bacterium]